MEKRNTKAKDKRRFGSQNEEEVSHSQPHRPSTSSHQKKPRRKSSSTSSMPAEEIPKKSPRRQSTSDEDTSDPPQSPKQGSKDRPSGPPLGPDGKPLPPPPIIGPDGKEIPRPTDAEGRPLPIYITKDGKPLLDKNGKPRPIVFDKDGKPLPPAELQQSNPTSTATSTPSNAQLATTPGVKPAAVKEKQPADFLYMLGVIDAIVSLGIAASLIYELVDLKSHTPPYHQKDKKLDLVASLICMCVGAISAGILAFGVHKKNWKLIHTWIIIASLLFACQFIVYFISQHFQLFTSVWTLLRFIVSSCTGCFECSERDPDTQPNMYSNYSNYGGNAYSGSQPVRTYPASTSTVVVQQVPVPMMGYGGGYGYGRGYGYGGGYGYPYGGYGYPYGGGYGGDAFLMGAMLGGGMYGGGMYGGMYCDDMFW